MGKSMRVVVIAILVLLVGSIAVLYRKVQTTSASYTALKSSEESTQDRYAAAINSIAEIQDSLSAINLGEPSRGLTPGGLQSEQRLTPSQGDEAMARIAVLKAGIERTKTRINQLESSLKKSGVKNKGLEKLVADLKQNVTEKEQLVTELSARVDSLTNEVSGLATQVQVTQDTVRTQRTELGTVYYVIGNKQDLTKQGILIAKGGVLGMGKTLRPTGNYNQALFTPLDTDNQDVVFIPSAKKAQVVSAQPPTSYSLTASGSGLELRILDPQAFRQVKHVVIVTA